MLIGHELFLHKKCDVNFCLPGWRNGRMALSPTLSALLTENIKAGIMPTEKLIIY